MRARDAAAKTSLLFTATVVAIPSHQTADEPMGRGQYSHGGRATGPRSAVRFVRGVCDGAYSLYIFSSCAVCGEGDVDRICKTGDIVLAGPLASRLESIYRFRPNILKGYVI